MEFNNLNELFERVYPTLVMKEEEFSSLGKNITKEEIWSYLSIKWRNKVDLSLNEVVNDILKLDYKELTR